MTLPKRGSRKLSVGGAEYRWIVSPDSGFMTLVVERAQTSGQRLEASYPYDDAVGHDGAAQQRVISPDVVRQAVEVALAQGWRPLAAGLPPFVLLDPPG